MRAQQYLGDAVYVEADEFGGVWLTTEDGTGVSTNRIYLEAVVYAALKEYFERQGEPDRWTCMECGDPLADESTGDPLCPAHAGWRLAMAATLAAIVFAIGLLLSAAFVAASALGDDGIGLVMMVAGGAVVASLLAALAWQSEGGA